VEVTVNYDKGILTILSSGDFSPNCDDFKKENGGEELETASTDNSQRSFTAKRKKELGQKVSQKVGLKRLFLRWEK